MVSKVKLVKKDFTKRRNYVTSTGVCRREMILNTLGISWTVVPYFLFTNVVITTKVYAIVKIVL